MKKVKLASLLTVVGVAAIATVSIPLSFNLNTSTNTISFDGTNLYAVENSTSTTAVVNWKYKTTTEAKQWEKFGKLKPEEVTEDDIKSLLTWDKYDAKINIEILKIETKHKESGYVEFKVSQTIDKFENGIPSGSEIKYISPRANGGKEAKAANETWSTQHLSGLLIPDKYNFKWRSVEEIAQFLESTDKTYESLTVEDVLLNMVERGDSFKLPEATSITKTAIKTEAEDKKYGSVKVEVTFDGSTDTQWASGKKPTSTEATYVIRGLDSTDSTIDTTMDLNSKLDGELSSINIDTTNKDNPLNQYLSGNNESSLTGNLTDLHPSELVNFGGNSALLDLLTKGTYLDPKNTDNKVAQLQYYGKNINDPNFSETTGLSKEEVAQLGINSVKGVANDADGSLQLIYQYTKYDVYRNKVAKDMEVVNYPAGTFAKNPDANKTLEFKWKDDSEIVGISSSYKVVNDFEANKNDQEFLKVLSNQFFNGSNDTYAKPRTVDIKYASGSRVLSTGNVVPVESGNTRADNKQVEVSLTFDSWNGDWYLDENGVRQEGYKTSKIFTLNNYQSAISGLKWKTQADIKNALGDISKMSVVEVADKLFTKEIPITTFVEGTEGKTVTYNITPSTGSISINVSDGTNSESNIFIGFLNEQVNNVTQFSWIPNSQIPQTLLATKLDEITADLIINEYLSKMDVFKDLTITPEQVKLTANMDTKSLLIEVSIDKYNQEVDNANKTFKIELKGFITTGVNDGNSYVAPVDLTIILSATLGSLISVALIAVLIYLLVKRYKLNKTKKVQVK